MLHLDERVPELMLYSLKRLVLPWPCGYIHEEETNQRPERLAGLERDGDGSPHKRQVFPLILGQAGFVRESKQKSTFSPSRREICFFSRYVSGVSLISDRVDGESERARAGHGYGFAVEIG